MSSVKLPYHPEIESQVYVTRFGVSEITTPAVYETPIKNKVIVRVDLLESLREYWGDAALHARNTTYSLVSGTCEDAVLRSRFASYYRKYSKVTNYINNLYECGSVGVPLLTQVINNVKEIVSNYADYVAELMSSSGGKYLVSTHCYVYYAFGLSLQLPELNGVKIIC